MKIEKGIPIPKQHYVRNRKHHHVYELVENMQVGDSFLASENLIFRGAFSSRAYLEKKYGIKLTQRKTPEGVRVWRIA